MYTADAKVLPPNAPEISGEDAIVDWFSGLSSAGVDGLQLATITLESGSYTRRRGDHAQDGGFEARG